MNFVVSINGDDFLNKCLQVDHKLSFLYQFANQLFFILDSRYLYLFCLFIFLAFSLIFSKISFEGSGEKYFSTFNQIHMLIIFFLSLLSFIDVTFSFIAYLIGQRSPCLLLRGNNNASQSSASIDNLHEGMASVQYAMPFVSLGLSLQFLFFCFSLHLFDSKWMKLVLLLIILYYTSAPVLEGLCSFFQAFVSLFLSYIIHFIAMKIKFRYIYVTNSLNFVISVAFFALFLKNYQFETQQDVLIHLCTGCFVSLIVYYLLGRYQYSHKGFNSIQATIDIIQELNSDTRSFVKQVDQGDSSDPKKIMRRNLFDSIVVLFIFLLLQASLMSALQYFSL